jgi:tight adherence protein C
MLLVLGLMAVFLGLLLALVAGWAIVDMRRQSRRQLAVVGSAGRWRADYRPELDVPFVRRVILPTLDGLSRLGRRLALSNQTARIRRRLDLAGNPPYWDVDRVLAFKMLGLIVGLVLGLVVPYLLGGNALVTLGCALLTALLGYTVPTMIVYQLGYNRTQQLRRELPDALDLMTISVEAGLSFDAALAQVARNTTGPMAEEFFRVLQEMQIGWGRAEAMRALSDRTDLPELRAFVLAMIQADAFGIPVANVLRIQADEMRVKRSQRAEEAAQKVPVKILFPLVFCIMPALFVVIMGPAAISIFTSLAGRL